MKYLIAVFLLLSIGCRKEVIVQTPAEEIAVKVQNVISSESIARVVPFEYSTSFDNTQFLGDYGSHYSFDGGFITLEGKSYNLEYLKKYEIRVINSINYLGLYF